VFDLPGGGTARVSWGKGIRKNTATSYVAVFEGEEVGERAPWIEKWGSDIAGRESGRSRIFHAKIGVGAIDKALAYVESIGGRTTHKTSRSHYEKYRDMARRADVTLLESTSFGTGEQLGRLYKADPLLNNIPLRKFDVYYIWTARIEGGPRSLSENTCMYKHLLIYEVLGYTPEFTD